VARQITGEPLESKRIAGDLLMFDQGRATPVHRAPKCRHSSGDSIRNASRMPPAHAQKPDLQRKSKLELGPATLLDNPGFLSRELEEHLDLERR